MHSKSVRVVLGLPCNEIGSVIVQSWVVGG